MIYEVILKSGRKFEVTTSHLSVALESAWLSGQEVGSPSKPKHADWLTYFRQNEIESYRKISD
jgi:hypothetical protein